MSKLRAHSFLCLLLMSACDLSLYQLIALLLVFSFGDYAFATSGVITTYAKRDGEVYLIGPGLLRLVVPDFLGRRAPMNVRVCRALEQQPAPTPAFYASGSAIASLFPKEGLFWEYRWLRRSLPMMNSWVSREQVGYSRRTRLLRSQDLPRSMVSMANTSQTQRR